MQTEDSLPVFQKFPGQRGALGLNLRRSHGLPRIYSMEVPRELRPHRSPWIYPRGSIDWGIEQDFAKFLDQRYPASVHKPAAADWVYLPVYWTRLQMLHRDNPNELNRLAHFVKRINATGRPVFTVCQHDLGPFASPSGGMVSFLGSRGSSTEGIDVPLLSQHKHRVSRMPVPKLLQASFTGSLGTHAIRKELDLRLRDTKRVLITGKPLKPKIYRTVLGASRIALAPRGFGGSSFRFFEAIEVGTPPWLIGDIDTRPFKSFIPWEEFSFYSRTVEDFISAFSNLERTVVREKAKNLSAWRHWFRFGSWNWLLIADLASRQ